MTKTAQRTSAFWGCRAGFAGASLPMSRFGASAVFAKSREKFSFAVTNPINVARSVLAEESG